MNFGKDSPAQAEERVATIQTVGGTGALSIAFFFLREFHNGDVYVSDPAYKNYVPVIEFTGLNVKYYKYYHPETKSQDFIGLTTSQMEMPIGSNVLFQSIAHNPTGVDPSLEQWKTILKICKERNLLIILDNAYQGFVSGDLQKDNFVIKLMVEENMNFILTSSFSKNFGVYGQRLGCIHVVTNNNDEARKVFSQLKLIQRSTVSQPVTHPAHIIPFMKIS